MFFHGGAPNLKKILPPSITGALSLALCGAESVCRVDRVYVTTDFQAAAIFAAMHPSNKGCVYLVNPEGELRPDPDYRGPDGASMECEAADVICIIPLDPKDCIKIRRFFLKEHYK